MLKKTIRFDEIKRILALGHSLANANFKLRNEGSFFGVLWYLLNPLALFLIILFIRRVAFSTTPILHYPIYLIVGLTLFNFFSQLVNSSITSVFENADFIKTMKISYESLVISKVIQSVYSHSFELVLIILLALYLKVPVWGFLFYPILLFFFVIFTVGVSFLFTTLGAYMSDFKNVWTVFSQLIFFVTPIFYVIHPNDPLYSVNFFNPLFYYVTIIRDICIYGTIPPFRMLIFTMFMSFISFLLGYVIFRRYKGKFPELV